MGRDQQVVVAYGETDPLQFAPATLLLLVLATGSVAAQGERTSTSNYVNCLSGNSFGCNRDRLTDAQRREVRQAELQRNYVNCLSGNAFGCNQNRLTDAQRAVVTAATDSAARALKPRCVENGSCYGDISAATGRPKTVYVGGYYRRDGTYVRGHYRSRPRR